ncbi:MAG: leucine dehydrogenase [Planctomycetota bacterium]|nr:leucine dehydrogenase [Planctomycetota bacterium]
MNILETMNHLGHERVVFHTDQATGLRAIIAIHDTTLGPALGGTRRYYYEKESQAIFDVLRLSEGMTYKSAAAGLPLGGGKSVLLLPKVGHQPTEAEGLAMGRFVDTFSGRYIAAEDVGVSPQFCDWMARETRYIMGGETVSHGGDPSPWTSLGCFNAMKACLKHVGKPVDFSNLTVAIQGVGATGYKLAKLLREAGAVVLVTDVHVPTIKRAVEELGCIALGNDQNLFEQEVDIISPCAMGGVLDATKIAQLRTTIVCGTANNILLDPKRDGELLKKRGICYAPDFIANAGGVIRLGGLYVGWTEKQVDDAVAKVEATTLEVLNISVSKASAYDAAVEVAMRRINAARAAKAKASQCQTVAAEHQCGCC